MEENKKIGLVLQKKLYLNYDSISGNTKIGEWDKEDIMNLNTKDLIQIRSFINQVISHEILKINE